MSVLKYPKAGKEFYRVRKIMISIGVILVTILLLLGACTSKPVAPASETNWESVEPSERLSFNLSTDTTPGNTDEYDSYSFSISLDNEQELYLSFYAEGAAVLVSITTPSDERLGYETSDGSAGVKDTGLGSLREKRTKAAAEGHFRFIPPESGLYLVTVKSAAPKGEIDVLVEYWIQGYEEVHTENTGYWWWG
jgi:hypothetical protein